MVASDAGAWARLRLVQGESGTAHWEFGGSASETRLTVGSNPSCQWVIEDPSVEPFHLVLRWDGASLSVAGSRESVALTLDGKPVGTSFERVAGRARVEFGRCALVAETSVGEVRRNRATVSSVPPATASRFASSQPPKAQGTSARPPVRTIMGVAPLTDSSPPTRTPAPGPLTGREQSGPSATAIGLPAAPEDGEESGPWSRPERSPSGSAMPRLGSDRPMQSTRYGMGDPSNVDVVSPEGLRRSSRPPHGGPDSGRPTKPGYRDSHPPRGGAGAGRHPPLRGGRSDPTPTDTRLVEDAVKVRAVAPVQPSAEPTEAPAPTEPSETPGGARRPALHPGPGEGSEPAGPSFGDSAWDPGASGDPRQFAPEPPLVRHSGPPPARKPSTFAIVLGLVALAGLGAWVYALSSL